VNPGSGVPSLASLSERSAELERDLVQFAEGPRFEPSLTAALREAAGPDGELDETDAIRIIDRFALQHRLPDGQTVVDRFVASRPDLTETDREMLLGWRDPVEGIFEVLRKDGDAVHRLGRGGRVRGIPRARATLGVLEQSLELLPDSLVGLGSQRIAGRQYAVGG
jgi:hypothetical protein